MPTLRIPSFAGGLNTRADKRSISPNEATSLANVFIDSGAIVPYRNTSVRLSTSESSNSIYDFHGTWLHSLYPTWYSESGDILYYANGGTPMKCNRIGDEVRLGIVAPSAAPVFNLVTRSGTAKIFPNNSARTFQYLVTYYSDPLLTGGWGGESAPSATLTLGGALNATLFTGAMDATTTTAVSIAVVSGALNATGGTLRLSGPEGEEFITYTGFGAGTSYGSYTVYTLTGVTRGAYGSGGKRFNGGERVYECFSDIRLKTIPVSSDSQVNARRIYRLVAGEWRLVGQINDNTTTTFTDTNTDDDLASASILTADDNDAPPDFTGICGPMNGMWFGWLDNTVYPSKVGLPDAFPATMGYEFPATVEACAVTGGRVVVVTQEGIHTLSGSAPDQLSQYRADGAPGSFWGRTVALSEHGLLYLSHEGVSLFDGVRGRCISSDKLANGTLSSVIGPFGIYYEGRYYLFDLLGNYIVDLRGGQASWTKTFHSVYCAHVSKTDGRMYVAMTDSIQYWSYSGTTDWQYTSGLLTPDGPDRIRCFHKYRIVSDGNVQVEILVDGQVKATDTINQGSASRVATTKRLPPGIRGRDVQIRLTGSTSGAVPPGCVYAFEIEYD